MYNFPDKSYDFIGLCDQIISILQYQNNKITYITDNL